MSMGRCVAHVTLSLAAIVLAMHLFPIATGRTEAAEGVKLEDIALAVRNSTTESYEDLLYEIGDYVRTTWRVEGSVTFPELTTRLSDDALALAVSPKTDKSKFRDVAAAADPSILRRIARHNRVVLAERVLERLKPILTKALCGKGGLLDELDDLKLKDVVVAVGAALGFSAAAGVSVAAVPAVVIAVAAIIIKTGGREYCLGTGLPVITSVMVTPETENCFALIVTGTGFTFGSEVLIEGPLKRSPTVYVKPIELRSHVCWMGGIKERPKGSIVNVRTPDGVGSEGFEIKW